MKHLTFLLILTLFVNALFSQSFSRVRVHATNDQINQLQNLGVCLDHGKHKFNTWIETDVSIEEIKIIKSQGVKVEILIDDIVAQYQNQSTQREMRSSSNCSSSTSSSITPTHFKLGSMGGYPTYTEVMSELDSMFLLYPTIIKQKTGIGSIITHDGYTVDWMKISDNPLLDETEPEILITALHHAREPACVTQLLYFMWYLLENYGTNAEITYLIDNTEIYLIPLMNPDGYLYNELIAPTGGGLWRKNRRDNLDGTFGVDLNRNYSYFYGFSGTSSTTSSDVYKGPFAFSEPETQAVRDFVFAHQFKIALNYHTYGNLLLFPYGYDYVDAVDKNYYEDITQLMVSQNAFVNESAVTLYPAAGDSDDWMYGDTIAKPRVLAMTPEVGSNSFGFWPPSVEIESISASTLFQNITALNLLHYYFNSTDANEEVYRVPGTSQYFKFNTQKLGLEPVGTSTVSIIPLSAELLSVGTPKSYTNISSYTTILDSINFTLSASIAQGTQLKFILQTTNGSGVINDTITKYYGTPLEIMNADFTSLSSFVNAGFLQSTVEFVSPSSSLTDSPVGDYSAFQNLSITSSSLAIPATSVFAQVKFNAKWAIEKGYDYFQVSVSDDGGSSFTPLCGKYTSTGTADQDPGQPLYDGVMSSWILEEMNLNNYIGSTIMLKVIFISDAGVQMDGFYMDDLIVEIINPNGIEEISALNSIQVWPNPAVNELSIRSVIGKNTFAIYDNTGRIVKTGTLNQGNNKLQVDDFASGNYILSIKNENESKNFKISIIK